MQYSHATHSHSRLIRPLIALILFLLPATALAVPQNVADVSADVAPPPGPYWRAEIPTGSVDVPADQPILIRAWIEGDSSLASPSESLEYVQITVTDAQGMQAEGSMSYSSDALAIVWTPAEPFLQGAQYSVSALFENARMASEGQYPLFFEDISGSFTINISGPTPALEPPVILSAEIVDYEDYSGSACCEGREVMCNDGICSPCISYAVSSPSIKLSFTNEVPGAPYVTYKIYVTDENGEFTERPMTFDIYDSVNDITVYPRSSLEYCVMVEALTLDGTQSASEEVCFDDADRMPLDLPGPEAELATCQPGDGLEVDEMEVDVLEPGDGPDGGSNPNQVGDDSAGDGCSCSTVRTASGPASHWPFGLVMAGLVLLGLGRRRTRQKH